MRQPKSMAALEDLGRVRLSPNFYMRDFLYSEIANFYGIPNIPDDPGLAVAAGQRLCQDLLEPLRAIFGHLAIRSAYRSSAVNDFGAKNGLNCARNEANYAHHIWDRRDAHGLMGATACIVVPWFADRRETGADWRALAWWIHDHLPYSSLQFFPKLTAFNINWHERPVRRIDSHITPTGTLTKPGMPNQGGRHDEWYRDFPPVRAVDSSAPNIVPSNGGKVFANIAGRREPFVAAPGEYAHFLATYPLTDRQRAMLVAHAAAGVMTATELAAAGGWSTFSSANLHYGKLGKAAAGALGLTLPTERNGTTTWTYAFASEAGNGGPEWQWRIHPELVEGLRIAGIIR